MSTHRTNFIFTAAALFSLVFILCGVLPTLAEGGYTGIVVDARGSGLARSMSPRIVSETASLLWDQGIRDIQAFDEVTYYGRFGKLSDKQMDYMMDHGITSYAKTQSDSCVKSRCGDNPLVVKGLRRLGFADDWVTVSREDGKAIQDADKVSGLVKNFKVAILVD